MFARFCRWSSHQLVPGTKSFVPFESNLCLGCVTMCRGISSAEIIFSQIQWCYTDISADNFLWIFELINFTRLWWSIWPGTYRSASRVLRELNGRWHSYTKVFPTSLHDTQSQVLKTSCSKSEIFGSFSSSQFMLFGDFLSLSTVSLSSFENTFWIFLSITSMVPIMATRNNVKENSSNDPTYDPVAWLIWPAFGEKKNLCHAWL